MKLYSIYDTVAKRFNAPFVAESDDVANRSFQYGLKGQPFASDMVLYLVGEWQLDAVNCSPLTEYEHITLISHFTGEVISNE